MKAIVFFKKYIEPFLAIAILVMLVLAVGLLFQEQKLKREISENCGWGEENYRCYCEKSEAIEMQNRLNQDMLSPDEWLDK